MSRLTERGEHVVGLLTTTGRRVIGNLTDAARFVFGGTTYDKTGGAVGDLEAGGTATRKRRRKHLISYQPPQLRKPIVTVKHGGSQISVLGGGAKQAVRIRAGVASITPLADGHKTRECAERSGSARSRVHSSGIHTRIYALRAGSGLLNGLVAGFRRATYAESAAGNSQPRAHGYTSIIRGDDSEDLLLLGLEPEDDELLLLA